MQKNDEDKLTYADHTKILGRLLENPCGSQKRLNCNGKSCGQCMAKTVRDSGYRSQYEIAEMLRDFASAIKDRFAVRYDDEVSIAMQSDIEDEIDRFTKTLKRGVGIDDGQRKT